MPDPRPLLDRRRFLLGAAAVGLSACARTPEVTSDAPVAAPAATPTPAPPAPTPTPAQPSPAPAAASTPAPVAFPEGITPQRIRIDTIGVDAPVIELTMSATEVEVPEDFDDAGWWVQSRRPGEIGPSLIGGHVDSKAGPAVFFRLRDLRPGDEVVVEDAAGETRSFVVTRDPIQVDKYDRPDEVMGFGEARPELRLITCGGDFNPTVGHYTDNIVVFCHDPAFSL